MGGYGSTRWGPGYRRKPRVEECYTLSIPDLLKAGALVGTVNWAWKGAHGAPVFGVQVSPTTGPHGSPPLPSTLSSETTTSGWSRSSPWSRSAYSGVG
jgi:hypothetical protein